jgi:hypothetical protein
MSQENDNIDKINEATTDKVEVEIKPKITPEIKASPATELVVTEKKDNTALASNDAVISSIDLFMQRLKAFETFAEYIARSSYRKQFLVPMRDAKGKEMRDENNEIMEEVSTADIVACLTLGQEMGLSEMGSIALGKQLNAENYKKVIRGRALGLDPIASLSLVSVIPTGNGDIFHTGVHVITNAMNKSGCEYEIVKDFNTEFIYYLVDDNNKKSSTYIKQEEYDNNTDKYVILSSTLSAEDVKDYKARNFTFVLKFPTKVTTVNFKRGNRTLTISYSLQEAIDAGLYKGTTSDGEKKNGKDNWNSNPATMLRNRALTNGGRIICSDIINNTYSHDEVSVISRPKDTSTKFNPDIAEDITTMD